jgi:hypothetical protein
MARIKGTPIVSELFERESIHAIANRYSDDGVSHARLHTPVVRISGHTLLAPTSAVFGSIPLAYQTLLLLVGQTRGGSACPIRGAALGRVAMHAKRVTFGKANVS